VGEGLLADEKAIRIRPNQSKVLKSRHKGADSLLHNRWIFRLILDYFEKKLYEGRTHGPLP
jgi:hypothetical protein